MLVCREHGEGKGEGEEADGEGGSGQQNGQQQEHEDEHEDEVRPDQPQWDRVPVFPDLRHPLIGRYRADRKTGMWTQTC